MNHYDHELVEQLAMHLTLPWVSASLNATGVVNILWAFARFQYQNSEIIDVIIGRCVYNVRRVRSGSHIIVHRAMDTDIESRLAARGIGSLLWSVASLGVQHNELFIRMVKVLSQERVQRSVQPHTAANIFWSLGKLHIQDSRVVRLLSSLMCPQRMVTHLTSRDTSNVLWSCAQMDHQDEVLLAALWSQAKRLAGEMQAQDIANVCYAMQWYATHPETNRYFRRPGTDTLTTN